MDTALPFFWHYLLYCSMAVGGMSTVMPDMYRYAVDEHGLLTGRQFADAYALGQAAPGPNALWITLVGLQAAGWLGAFGATLATFIPATVFTFTAIALHARNPQARLALAIRRGMAPVALGFMLASAWVLLKSIEHGWHDFALTVVTVGIVLRTKVNPLWLIAAGAIAGVAGFV